MMKLIEIKNSILYVDGEYYGKLPRTELKTPIKFVINFLTIHNTNDLPVRIIIDDVDRTIECRSFVRYNHIYNENLTTSEREEIQLQMRRTIPYIVEQYN